MKKNLKKVISAVLALALAMSSFVVMTTSAATFADVADTASYAEAVNALAALGAIAGTGDGTFKPDDNITRAEAATMVVAALNLSADAQNAGSTSKFADVNEQAKWAIGYVNVGVAQNYISGTSATTFNPLDNVTYAQMLTMLTRILGYGDFAVSRGGYPDGYVTSAAIAGIVKGVAAGNEEPITRAQAAQLIWNAVQAPMLDITTFTGSIDDTQLKKMDGTSASGNKFKTVLSDKFDAYVLDIKVTASAKSDDTLEAGTINMVRTNNDQWDPDRKFSTQYVTVDGSGNEITLNYSYDDVAVGNTAAEDYVHSTAKVVAERNDDGDWKLIYFAPTQKISTKAVDGTLVDDVNTTATELKIKKSKTSRSTTDYKLTAGAKYYVNGVDMGAISGNVATVTTLLKNSVGDTVLYKDANAGGNVYDKVMITAYALAKVNQVTASAEKTVVRFSSFNAIPGTSNEADLTVTAQEIEEGEKVVTVIKNDQSASLESLAKGDIVAIKYNPNKSFDDGVYFDILATDKKVTGAFTAEDTVEGLYTVAGADYEKSGSLGTITAGNTYTFLLDPFGKLFAAEDEVTRTSFAIVEKYNKKNYNGAEYGALYVITPDGQQKTLYVEPTYDAIDTVMGTIKTLGAETTSFSDKALDTRVIEYGVKTSTGRVNSVKVLTSGTDVITFSGAEYIESTNKLGKNLTADATVINASKYNAALTKDLDDIKASSLSSLVSNQAYNGFVFAQNATSKKWAHVVLTFAGNTYGASSDFAIAAANASSNSKTEVDDEVVYTLRVMKDGADEAQVLNIATDVKVNDGNDAFTDINMGDVFFYTVDSYGLVDRIDVVLSGVAGNFNNLTNAAYSVSLPTVGSEVYDAAATPNPGKWYINVNEAATTSTVEPIQMFLAPVVSATDASVSFGAAVSSSDEYIDTETIYDYAIAADANIYYYDLSDSAPTNYTAFSAGLFNGLDLADVDGNGYAWFKNVATGTFNYNGLVQYAFVMVVDGVVTNALVFGGEYVAPAATSTPAPTATPTATPTPSATPV